MRVDVVERAQLLPSEDWEAAPEDICQREGCFS